MKKYFLILITIVLILSLSACSLVGGPTKIETTDFNDVQALLIERYELCLPDSAVFVDGYFDNAFRDPAIVVAFTIKKSELEKMLSENWVEAGYIDEPNSFLAYSSITESFSADKKYDFQGEPFTFLWCDDLENDNYTCVFHGHHPSEYF
jgi:hypothetical protein